MSGFYTSTVEAEKVAAELTKGEMDGWTYRVKNNENDPDVSCIEVYDETGEFINMWMFEFAY